MYLCVYINIYVYVYEGDILFLFIFSFHIFLNDNSISKRNTSCYTHASSSYQPVQKWLQQKQVLLTLLVLC